MTYEKKIRLINLLTKGLTIDEISELTGLIIEERNELYTLKEEHPLVSNNTRFLCVQEIWQGWCDSESVTEFDTWLHNKLQEW